MYVVGVLDIGIYSECVIGNEEYGFVVVLNV